MIVVHNLFNLCSISNVERAIKEFILDIFDVEENFLINLGEEIDTYDHYFRDRKTKNVYHFVFAKNQTEAGNYFNYTLKKFILAI